jgi:hypothetical protein
MSTYEVCDMDTLDNHDNTTQLSMLYSEIQYIQHHEFNPPDNWFEERMNKINTYITLDWNSLGEKFERKNKAIYDACKQIVINLELLSQQYSTSPVFHLGLYASTIKMIYDLWNYYSSMYIGTEDDINVIELIEGLMHL